MEMPFRYLQSPVSSLKYCSFNSGCWEGSCWESFNLPMINWPSKDPKNVLAGRVVLKVKWGKPWALLLNIKPLNCPGPHQTFSVEAPNSKELVLILTLDWPKPKRAWKPCPNRSG